MKYTTDYISKKHKFTLGTDPDTGIHFVGIPVANGMIDYIEPYRITQHQFDEYLTDEDKAVRFVEACRRREMDELLLQQPGTDRGTPV